MEKERHLQHHKRQSEAKTGSEDYAGYYHVRGSSGSTKLSRQVWWIRSELIRVDEKLTTAIDTLGATSQYIVVTDEKVVAKSNYVLEDESSRRATLPFIDY